MVMAASNFISGSSNLKYDDLISVILSEETCRKTSGGSISRSALNAQSRGKMTERGNNSRNHGKSRRKSNRKRLLTLQSSLLLVTRTYSDCKYLLTILYS